MESGWTLPEKVRNKARQLRGAADARQWEIGDFLNEQWSAAPRRHRLSTLYILAGDIGLGKSTARLYRRVSSTFPDGARDLFAEGVATWGHARVAVSAPNPADALAWVVLSADERGGTPATVDQLAIHVKESKQPKPPTRRQKIERLLTDAHRKVSAAVSVSASETSPRAEAWRGEVRTILASIEWVLARVSNTKG